ncbi:MAG TPA: nucleotidyl transferase AbiEii/AbiGii toxin family protein [Acidobacteriaceae bacterium]|nr:nucleotidyl transferase AbiEii/AbiGii toxin family protein [Acidobacteriaceae bacterium]
MPSAPRIDYRQIRRIAITAIFSDDVLFGRVVLKGGNALSLALGLSKRTSLDLDFSIENDFEDIDDTRDRVQRALKNRFLAAGFVVFDFKFEAKPSVVPAGQSLRWGGYMASFKVVEKQKYESLEGDLMRRRRDSLVIGPGQQRVFIIDLSKYEYVAGKLELELDDYTIYVYSPSMIAIEKLRAICQQMPEYTLQRRPSARARDFYDIHLIAATTGMSFNSPENLELVRHIFAAKEVPLGLLGKILDQREFHRPDWDSVRNSSNDDDLAEFDVYFDFVVEEVKSMKALWEK